MKMANIYKNRKASHEYIFIQTYEAGIVLMGTEIKSIREGKLNFLDSFGKVENNELWLYSLHISPYEKGNIFNHNATRKRKLLLHHREIMRIASKVAEQGMTIVPIEIYMNEQGKCKIKIALAKGKHSFDKRESLHEKDRQRDTARQLKNES
jgi:SsrA-binding protein